MPSWVPDWRWTDGTLHCLLQLEDAGPNRVSPYAASLDSSFPNSFDEPELCIGPVLLSELRLKGSTIARVTHLTPHASTMLNMPARQTLRSQALLLQYNQTQIKQWEKVFQQTSASSSTIYTPTGDTEFEAMYNIFTAGIIIVSETHAHAAIAGFERRERILRLFPKTCLQGFLWAYKLVVLAGHFLRRFEIENPQWAFRSMVSQIANRKGARFLGEDGRIMYFGLVPGTCKLGDDIVLYSGINVPFVLRRRDPHGGDQSGGEKYKFVSDCYVHGIMKGEAWDEESCEDIMWFDENNR